MRLLKIKKIDDTTVSSHHDVVFIYPLDEYKTELYIKHIFRERISLRFMASMHGWLRNLDIHPLDTEFLVNTFINDCDSVNFFIEIEYVDSYHMVLEDIFHTITWEGSFDTHSLRRKFTFDVLEECENVGVNEFERFMSENRETVNAQDFKVTGYKIVFNFEDKL